MDKAHKKSKLGWGILFGLVGILFLPNIWSCRLGDMEERVLAKVNGEAIPVREFRKQLIMTHPNYGKEAVGLQMPPNPQVKLKILDQMIRDEVLRQEAETRSVQVPTEILDRHVAMIRKDFSGAEFSRILEDLQISESEWFARERDRLRVQFLLDQVLPKDFEVTPEEIRNYFERHPEEFEEPEEVRIQQIVVATEAEAHKIRKEILAARGQNFSELARKHSLSPEAQDGGEMGFYQKGMLPEVFDGVFDLRVGKISPVTESEYGFHIFKLIERKNSSVQSFEQVQNEIRLKIYQEKKDRFLEQWIEQRIKEAKIKRYEKLLAKI